MSNISRGEGFGAELSKLLVADIDVNFGVREGSEGRGFRSRLTWIGKEQRRTRKDNHRPWPEEGSNEYGLFTVPEPLLPALAFD